MHAWTSRAVLGSPIWIAVLLLSRPFGSGEAEAGGIVVGACLVAVPLALALICPPGRESGRWALAGRLQLPCALSLCGSFLLPTGVPAGALSLPWLLFSGLIAMLGLLAFVERGGGPWSSMAEEAGLVFLVVAGVWTAASRFGVPLLGFEEPWVILTAAHFHYAGLVLPIVTGNAARVVGGDLGVLASAGVVTGVPLVAVGITLGAQGLHTIEWLAALWMMAAGVLTASLLLIAALRQDAARGLCMVVAGVSLLSAMALVGVYATGVWTGNPILDIPLMVRSHGLLNGFGFALPALTALRPRPRPAGMEVLLPVLGDRPVPGLWEARELRRGWEPGAVHDVHEVRLPDEAPGPPAAAGSFSRAADAIMGYEAFPPDLLRGIAPRVPVAPGDTLRGRYRFLPGVEMVFAARVTAVFDEERDGVCRKGFVYGTLVGHPIGGEETFSVEKELATGRVVARISSRSAMSTRLARAARPLVRWLQVRAGRAGVEHLSLRAGSPTGSASP